jgi:hypothetical protein
VDADKLKAGPGILGRLQVRAEVLLRRAKPGEPIPDDGVPISLEILDNVTGKTRL